MHKFWIFVIALALAAAAAGTGPSGFEGTERIDIAFVPPVHEAKWQYSAQNRDLFRMFAPAAVFPMHAAGGDPMYLEFQGVFAAEFPGLRFLAPMKLGQRFVYKKGLGAK